MTIVIYILKLVTCSAVLYGYYHFFLRNRKFHLYNRYFLLLSFLLAIILPLIRIPFLQSEADQGFQVLGGFAPTMLPEVVLTLRPEAEIQGSPAPYIVLTVYGVIVIFLLFRLVSAFRYLVKLKKEYPSIKLPAATLFLTNEPGTPFSFFKWIFWDNKLDIGSTTGQQVLQHELYHAREKHSADLLLAESLIVIFWFNPFFYLIRKELKTIHEFLADKAAFEQCDRNDYAELLLLHAIAERKHQLSHSFFQNEIKRRITMITATNKNRFAWLRRVMCVPFLYILAIACSRSTDVVPVEAGNKSAKDVMQQFVKGNVEKRITRDTLNIRKTDLEKMFLDEHKSSSISIKVADENAYISFEAGPVYALPQQDYFDFLKTGKSVEQVFTKMEVTPAFPGGVGAWMRYLNTKFRYPDEAVEKEIQGTVVVSFMVDKEGNVGDVTALSGPEILKTEAIRVIKESGKWIPARQNGNVVTAYHKQPITFRLQRE